MFEKILLPLDGSSLSERSLPHAIEFARIFKSRILLLHVMESTIASELMEHTEPLNWQLLKAKTDSYMQKIANQIRAILNDIDPSNETSAEERVTVTILEGKIAENIVDFAHKENIDLLVISSHGSGGFSRWNLNSVTTKVVNMIYKPFLLIRGQQAEIPAPGLLHYDRVMLPIDCSRRSECSINAGISIAKSCHSRLLLSCVIKSPEITAVDPYNHELQELKDQFMKLSRKTVQHYLEELSQRLGVENEIRIVEHHSVVQAIIDMETEEKADLLIFCAHGYTGDLSWPYGMVARSVIEYSTKPVLVIQDQDQLPVHPTEAALLIDRNRSKGQ